MLNNLVTNAFRYTREGVVVLGCRKRGNRVEIQVWDTGPGIPVDQQAMIFEEFVQLQNPARDRTQGLGLGLAIVRRTAELLKHPLELKSTPGRGSMFSITVPEVRAAKAPVPQRETRTEATAGGIIVVEDESDILEAMEQLLTIEGHRVYAGRSAAEAQAVHAAAAMRGEAAVDLIISDYRLAHGAKGLEAIRTLCAYLGHTVPSIIITGDTSPSRLKEVSAGGSRILHKPISEAELRQAIQVAWADGNTVMAGE